MMRRPLIGLTADLEDRPEGPSEAEYVLRRNYTTAIVEAGGLPVILPYDPDLTEDYIARLDALVVTGGMFDIDPALYGETAQGDQTTKPERTAFERALLDVAIRLDMPVLGICNGMQLLAVTLGGSLVQDIDGGIEHLPSLVPDTSAHEVRITQGSNLFALAEETVCSVNSLHHQSVRASDAYIVSAVSVEDGVIEAIEATQNSFCFGVQWHPEYKTSPLDIPILKALVEAARSFALRSEQAEYQPQTAPHKKAPV